MTHSDQQPPAPDLGWVHHFEAGDSGHTLLLLHGTGGSERDLLPLGREVAPQAGLLSVRGRSLEEGAPRFFRRYSATRYDQSHLKAEAEALADFVAAAAAAYGFDPAGVHALGYSNGANIALASLLLRPEAYAGAALLRPVMALEDPPTPALSGKRVLLLPGVRDPYAPYGAGIAAHLRGCGAAVTESVTNAGHELTGADLQAAQAWLKD